VKNAFLHGTLSDTVYCYPPTGFVGTTLPDHVCHLNKSSYGLRLLAHGTFASQHTCLLALLKHSLTLHCSSITENESIYLLPMWMTLFLLLPVTLLRYTTTALQQEFSMKDLGHLHRNFSLAVLGWSVHIIATVHHCHS
jgi:hypothetical protein